MASLRTVLLGSAAIITGGAHAADLPAKTAAPVEYVRICSTHGNGFFYIPGTETCLRVGGRARAEFRYVEPTDRSQDAIGFRARGRIQLDARTATAYGLLRTFVRFEMTRDTGVYGFSSTSANVDQAFVQFGGLTAGRTISFFTNSDLPNENWGTLRFYDAPTVNVFAYTFSFGNGFSATLAAEEGTYATSLFPEAGQTMPDLVANVKYTGTWGSAQLGGVVHQIRSAALDPAVFGPVLGGTIPDSEYGWAVSAQGYVNLPMLAEGDALWLAATYADGALGYLGFDPEVGVGAAGSTVVDAYIGADGNIDTGRGWSIAGGINHYWTPTIRQSVFGSYARVDYSVSAAAQANDFTEWRAGSNLIWSPVSGLDIGVEVLYSNLNPRGIVGTDDDDDAWEGRLRVQRDF